MTRRDFILKGGGAVLATSAVAYPLIVAHRLQVTSETVYLPDLPAAFDGFRIVVGADFHHGLFFPLASVEAAVTAANALNPDLVLLLGDYAYHERRCIPPVMGALSRLKAPSGVFAVLGNHDIEIDRSLTSAELARRGLVELTNRGVWLERGGQRMLLCGIDDLWRGTPLLPDALKGSGPGDFVLLMSHNPDVLQQVVRSQVSFVVAGHTHGGQVHFPFVGSPIVPSAFGQRYRYGVVCGPEVPGYVSSGVGCVFPPVRFDCPAEIACLTLRRSAGPDGGVSRGG